MRLMPLQRLFSFLALAGAHVCAQTVPTLSVDAVANRHPISPDIYGINDYSDKGLANVTRVGVRRWGGDATSRYNWLLDTFNSANDYYFENFAYGNAAPALPNGSEFDRFVENGLTTGTKRIGTIPMLGWLPKSRDFGCSFSVAKYGPQQKVDPYNSDCGNGFLPDGKTRITNDPNDVSQVVDQTFSQQWIQHVIARYGTAVRGGVQVWSLDNEPEYWYGVHIDVHPNTATYDEMLSRGQTYAAAIKAADPSAAVTGPVAGGWPGMFYSAQDFYSGYNTGPNYVFYGNPVDRNAHGGVPFVEWYLQQMAQYEAQHGTRLLDYVDVHAYIAPDGIGFATTSTPADDTLRLTSTRVFWDPNYAAPDGSTPSAAMPGGEPPYLVPRMKQWVAADYPGTKTAITEYNWGMLNDITGAIAQADILGIFGREGLDLATLWGPPNPTANPPDPGVFAFEMYLNYDGSGNQFGETSVSATTSNADQLSIFAAQRSDSALTIMVLNKTTSDASTAVSIANFAAAGSAQTWQYTSANLSGIRRGPDAPVSGEAVAMTFPARSMTLLVIPAVASTPKPVVAAVGNAASYNTNAIAPGEIIVIYGSNLGPSSLVNAALTADGGYLTQTLAGVRVLVNGVPAPMVYAVAGQVAAIIPYQTSLVTQAAMQVEVSGVRSDPFVVSTGAAVPALFTHDGSGKGPGAILNQDLSVNSASNPASAGSIVVLYATGEGVTSPPGVDGRLSSDVLPVPVGTCSASIGNQPAKVLYCGAAPGQTSGLLQINAQMAASVSAGNAPVSFAIGGVASQAGVTIAVK